MSNRFPGMDPYLEDPAFWEDFHRRFIPEIADALLERLPHSYDAHIDERIRLEEHRDVWVEIVHLAERNLVTAIEVLSPTNKAGDDAADYHNKPVELYTRNVNLVEIDLLRGGNRLTFAKPLPVGDYFAFVTRQQRRPLVDVYGWGLRDRLPAIPIPLMPQDGDVQLDLASVFASAYERGRYSRRLRYDRPLRPPLTAADQIWAAQLTDRAET